MPSDKRQRQRENSRARQEAATAAAARSRRRTRIALATIAVVLIGGAIVWAMQGDDDTSKTAASTPSACPPKSGTKTRVTSFEKAPKMCIDEDKDYTALVKTDVGDITIKLRADDAPKTVNNFVFLARNHYYDGVVFHRVVVDFMDQTGDPEGTGRGGPGYQFNDEVPNGYQYKAGDVAMANAGPNTNGSQFFFVATDNGAKQLTPSYTPFGTVTNGMDVVKKINDDGGTDQTGTPKVQHKMISVTITEE